MNKNLKAQTSIHFVAGSERNFKAWGRPFKFTSEIFYKYLDNLVPYEVDNVRLRYFANNNAQGYATGIDFRVNGEFVKDAESWASLSFMKTEEKIIDSTGHTSGYIPRRTDQRVNFSIFFQDYLPNDPTYKMNLTCLLYTSPSPRD